MTGRVHARPGQLKNSLLNLCTNSRDAMPDGGKLTIETGDRRLDERTACERDLEPGQDVSLCVSEAPEPDLERSSIAARTTLTARQ